MAVNERGRGDFDIFTIDDFRGGMKSNPISKKEAFMLLNLYIREDGKLIPRGTTFEYPLSSVTVASGYPSGQSSSYQYPLYVDQTKLNANALALGNIDRIINNVGNGGGYSYLVFFTGGVNAAISSSTQFLSLLGATLGSGNYAFTEFDRDTARKDTNITSGSLNYATIGNNYFPSSCYGLDNNGNPLVLFCTWDDQQSTDEFFALSKYAGPFDLISTVPPGQNLMVGFYEGSVFVGGGSSSGGIPFSSTTYWSTPGSLTDYPVTNFNTPFVDKGMFMQDFSVTNSQLFMMSSSSLLSLTGIGGSNTTAIEIGRVEDNLLKFTLAIAGTTPISAGINSVYVMGSTFTDISIPIKGLLRSWYGTVQGTTNSVNYGNGSISLNDYFYAVQANPIPGSYLPSPILSVLPINNSAFFVHDLRWSTPENNIWYYWTYPFFSASTCPLSNYPAQYNAQVIDLVSGFAFSGQSAFGKYNAIYENVQANSYGYDTVEGYQVNYNTAFTTAPLDFGVPYGLKKIGGLEIIGNAEGSLEVLCIVEIELFGQWIEAWRGKVKMNEWAELPEDFLQAKRFRISVAGNSRQMFGGRDGILKVAHSRVRELVEA